MSAEASETSQLFDYQDSHVEGMYNSFKSGNKFVLDESPSGSGKTETSAKLAKKMGMHVVLIAEKNILNHWAKILTKYDLEFDVVNYECFKSGKLYGSNKNRTNTYSRKKPFLGFKKKTLVIFDEIHACKNNTGNQKVLMNILGQKIPVLGLSATLKDKRNYLPPYESFKMKVSYQFANNITFTRSVEEVRAPSFDPMDVRALEISKVPLYLKYFEERTSDNVIIFTNFNETIGILAKALRAHNPIIVNGQAESMANYANIAKFQKKGGLLLINSLSGGQSINLQDLEGDKPRFIIANLMWSGTLFKQMLYRAHRINSKSDTNQVILVTEAHIDKYMFWILAKKLNYMGEGELLAQISTS